MHFSVKLNLFLILFVSLNLAPPIAEADFKLENWKYFRDITLPLDFKNSGYIGIPIPEEIFGNASKDLKDLRIIRDNLQEEPYKLEISKEIIDRELHPAKIDDKGYIPGGLSWVILDLGQNGVLHNEIEILTQSQEFSQEARISTSRDNETWIQIHKEIIFDFNLPGEKPDSKFSTIQYPESTSRYIRVSFREQWAAIPNIVRTEYLSLFRESSKGSSPTINLSGTIVAHSRTILPEEVEYSIGTTFEIEEEGSQSTKILIDLGKNNKPSHRLAIDTSQTNFFRDVTLEASNDLDFWTTVIMHGTFYSFDIGTQQAKQLILNFPETDSRYLRLTIRDGDNAPLEDSKELRIWGAERRIIFFADPGSNYKFYYGNLTVESPNYDIERFLPAFARATHPLASVKPEQPNDEFEAPLVPHTERYPWLLGAVVGIASIILGFLTLRVLRKSSNKLDSPEESP